MGINLEEQFQQKIDQEIKIEPKDWMPQKYRHTLIRQISQHAHSEVVGILPTVAIFGVARNHGNNTGVMVNSSAP